MGKISSAIAGTGKKVLLTYGVGSIKKNGLYDRVTAKIRKAGLELFELSGIDPSPCIDTVGQRAQLCKDKGIDVLLAVGGGSTLYATKWMAAGACVDHAPWNFLDRSKSAPVEKALPVISVLTIAATGIVSPTLLLKASFLDPIATYSVGKY